MVQYKKYSSNPTRICKATSARDLNKVMQGLEGYARIINPLTSTLQQLFSNEAPGNFNKTD